MKTWIKTIIEHLETSDIRLADDGSATIRKEWVRQVFALRGEPFDGAIRDEDVFIEFYHNNQPVGIVWLYVDWQPSMMRLHIKMQSLMMDEEAKALLRNRLSELGYGFDVIFDEQKETDLTPIVILDVADDIEDALEWQESFSEAFELNHEEGDIVFLARGGDLLYDHHVIQGSTYGAMGPLH